MTSLTIYFEGGGDTAEQKAQLRRGMDAFLTMLKNRARVRKWYWKLVPCGGRQATFDAFTNARLKAARSEIIILLVNSEALVTAASCAEHLRQRDGDGWDLSGVEADRVHMMAQAMEAWIVADPDALATYYGQGFRRDVLPQRKNLEEEPKSDCAEKLAVATRGSQKGTYHKIRHASDLLARISTEKVRDRCPSGDFIQQA